jgi:aminopeptidase N
VTGEPARRLLGEGASIPEGRDVPFELDGARQKLVVHLEEAGEQVTGREFGDPIAVIVDYSARPRGGLYFIRPDKDYPDRGLFAYSQGETEDNRYWFPSYDFPDDKATSELAVTVPSGLEATSIGRRLEVRDNPDGSRTFRYRMDTPQSTYLVAIVVGRFDRKVDQWQGVELEYRVPAGRGGDIDRSFSRTADMMDFFSELTGLRYPFARYAQNVVPQFIYGGMENVTASTLSDRTLHDQRAHVDYPSEGLVAHELAHQWFGDLLTCENWSEAWLNEGFATYLTQLWQEHDLGRDEFDLRIRDTGRRYVGDASRHVRPLVTRLYREQSDLFDSVIYSKGAWVVHMLRRMLGDGTFIRGLRLYVQRHAYGTVETVDLRRAMEEVSGRDLGRFFDQWAHRAGHPEIRASWEHLPEEGLVRLTVSQVSVRGNLRAEPGSGEESDDGKRSRPSSYEEAFRLDTAVELVWEESTVRHPLRLERDHQDILIPVDKAPRALIFDPELALLKDLKFERSSSELLFLLRRGRRGIDRMEAALALGSRSVTDDVVAALALALANDPFRGVRQAAAEALGELRGERARDAIIDSLPAEADSRVREAATKALGRFTGDETAGRQLKRLIAGDDSYAVRAAAAEGLGAVRPDKAFEVLVDALRIPSHREVVRGAALRALAKLGDDRAGDHLFRFARRGAPEPSRPAAIEALALWGSERSDRAVRRAVREKLEFITSDSDFRPRSQAVRSLGALGEQAAEPLLRRIETRAFDGRLRTAARRALRELARARAETEALARLRREVDELRIDQKGLSRRVDSLEERGLAGATAEPYSEEGKGASEE